MRSGGSTIADELTDAVAALHAAADPARSAAMSAYMKDQFEFLGVTSPERGRHTAAFLNSTRTWNAPQVWEAIDVLWDLPEREFRYLAVDLIKRRSRVLARADLPRLEYLIRADSWWDTVDALASHGVGAVVMADNGAAVAMDAWIGDADFWIARTAILHQLRFKDETDEDRLFRYALDRAGDREFFIRKAIGWALREYAKTAPHAVADFVIEHRAELSGLTVREATKHLPGKF